MLLTLLNQFYVIFLFKKFEMKRKSFQPTFMKILIGKIHTINFDFYSLFYS